MARASKDRKVPYKVLAYLLYAPQGSQNWMEVLDNGTLRLKLGDLAKFLGTNRVSTVGILQWLKDQKLILSMTRVEIGKFRVAAYDVILREVIDRSTEKKPEPENEDGPYIIK